MCSFTFSAASDIAIVAKSPAIGAITPIVAPAKAAEPSPSIAPEK